MDSISLHPLQEVQPTQFIWYNMSILVGTTKKIAVMNDADDASSPIHTACWHSPIVRVGGNSKLCQPGTNGIAFRWNLNPTDIKLTHSSDTWSGKVTNRFNASLETTDTSPAGSSSTIKKVYDTSAYSWASNITFTKGSAGGNPDYIKLPSDIRTYTGYTIDVDMFVTCTAGSPGYYNPMNVVEFGIAVQVASSFSKNGTWTRLPVDSAKWEHRTFGNQGSVYTGSVSKSELTIPYNVVISTSTLPIFIVPFISADNVLYYARYDYVTDIMLGIKLKK